MEWLMICWWKNVGLLLAGHSAFCKSLFSFPQRTAFLLSVLLKKKHVIDGVGVVSCPASWLRQVIAASDGYTCDAQVGRFIVERNVTQCCSGSEAACGKLEYSELWLHTVRTMNGSCWLHRFTLKPWHWRAVARSLLSPEEEMNSSLTVISSSSYCG